MLHFHQRHFAEKLLQFEIVGTLLAIQQFYFSSELLEGRRHIAADLSQCGLGLNFPHLLEDLRERSFREQQVLKPGQFLLSKVHQDADQIFEIVLPSTRVHVHLVDRREHEVTPEGLKTLHREVL